MKKTCLACGFENQEPQHDVCPQCDKYYIKTDALYKDKKQSPTPSSQAEIKTENKNRPINYNLLAVGFICIVIGYFAGREHIKYELKQVISKAGQSFSKTMTEGFKSKKIRTETKLTPKKQKETSDWKQTCSTVGDMAEQIMKSRQSGMAISVLMDLVKDTKLPEGSAVEGLILQAYEKPRFSTDKHIKRSIENFKNDGYMACVKDLR
jgi:hypothetical protein